MEALRPFAFAITLLTVVRRTLLGFEQSWAQSLIALATACTMEILLGLIDARVNRRTPLFIGGLGRLADFLLSGYIGAWWSGCRSTRMSRMGFATAVVLSSKVVLRVRVRVASHFLGSAQLMRARWPIDRGSRYPVNMSVVNDECCALG